MKAQLPDGRVVEIVNVSLERLEIPSPRPGRRTFITGSLVTLTTNDGEVVECDRDEIKWIK